MAEAALEGFEPHVRKHRAFRQLHELLQQLPQVEGTPMDPRWLARLGRWVRAGGSVPKLPATSERDGAAGGRLRLLVHALETAPVQRAAFRSALAATLAKTSGLRLFSQAGLPNPGGFFTEAMDRASRSVIPMVRDPSDLGALLHDLFPRERDLSWLDGLDAELAHELARHVGGVDGVDPFRTVRESMTEAIALVAARVCALGLQDDVRARSPAGLPRQSPFFRLPRAYDALLSVVGDEGAEAPRQQCLTIAGECRAIVQAVYRKLEDQGVSVDMVYRLDTITKGLDRLDSMAALLVSPPSPERSRAAIALTAQLGRDRLRDESMLGLVRGNLQLLARKIVERAGHTGEHYITSSRRDYLFMLLSAGGGGVLTAATTVGKFLIGWQHFPLLLEGLLAGGNYALSFVVMQLCGFTLATKQPSMTAAALAGALGDRRTAHRHDQIVSLIARTTRSQLAAAIGNVGLVIPAAYAVDRVNRHLRGAPFLDRETAEYVVHSLHPLHGTIWYATLTGVLLWVSSIAAGWIENFAVYSHVAEGIAQHPIRRFVGSRATRWLSRFFARNVSGFGGNVTLGFLLGLTPVLGKFSGLPLDVRHVTLSTGALVLAVCGLGREALRQPDFAWAALGIAIIGALNFGVSFVLALSVALRARGVDRRGKLRLLGAFLSRLVRSPFEFVFPPKSDANESTHSSH